MRHRSASFLLSLSLFVGCAAEVPGPAPEARDKAVITTALVWYFVGPGDEMTYALAAWLVTSFTAVTVTNIALAEEGIYFTVEGTRGDIDDVLDSSDSLEIVPGGIPEELVLRAYLWRDLRNWAVKPSSYAGSPPWVSRQLAEAERYGGRLHRLELDLPNRAGRLVITGPQKGILTETIQGACLSFTGNPACGRTPTAVPVPTGTTLPARLTLVDGSHAERLEIPMAITLDDETWEALDALPVQERAARVLNERHEHCKKWGVSPEALRTPFFSAGHSCDGDGSCHGLVSSPEGPKRKLCRCAAPAGVARDDEVTAPVQLTWDCS